jgi:hypothetical protein
LDTIGIVGAGIAALQLGLSLQRHGLAPTLYSDRTPDQIRAGRLPNTVARFEPTRARERALGVEHWDDPALGVHGADVRINGTPIAFRGALSRPASFVDMRLYQAALLEDFAGRGGRVVLGPVGIGDLLRLAGAHALVVVASGRGRLAGIFPVLTEHSPYAQPQRRLCAGLFRGIAPPEPADLAFTISPGHGEVFSAPFFSIEGMVSNLLIEAVPGGGLEPITHLRYEDDPRRFERAVLNLLRDHAPDVYERVDPRWFGLTRPLDLHKGAITPVVRRGYARLGDGRYAVAIGDAHVQNDPVLGQGANAASHAAAVLGEAILAGGPFDEPFCRRVEREIWAYTRHVTEWSNAALQPPPPHAVEIFAAAARNGALADELVDNFTAPARNWAIFGSPAGAAAFLARHGQAAAA